MSSKRRTAESSASSSPATSPPSPHPKRRRRKPPPSSTTARTFSSPTPATSSKSSVSIEQNNDDAAHDDDDEHDTNNNPINHSHEPMEDPPSRRHSDSSSKSLSSTQGGDGGDGAIGGSSSSTATSSTTTSLLDNSRECWEQLACPERGDEDEEEGDWATRPLYRTHEIDDLIGWAIHMDRPDMSIPIPPTNHRATSTSTLLPPDGRLLLELLDGPPLRPSLLGYIQSTMTRILTNSSEHSLWETWDTSALVAMGMLLEDMLTVTFLPLAYQHTQRCQRLAKPHHYGTGTDEAEAISQNHNYDDEAYREWTIPPRECLAAIATRRQPPATLLHAGMPTALPPTRICQPNPIRTNSSGDEQANVTTTTNSTATTNATHHHGSNHYCHNNNSGGSSLYATPTDQTPPTKEQVDNVDVDDEQQRKRMPREEPTNLNSDNERQHYRAAQRWCEAHGISWETAQNHWNVFRIFLPPIVAPPFADKILDRDRKRPERKRHTPHSLASSPILLQSVSTSSFSSSSSDSYCNDNDIQNSPQESSKVDEIASDPNKESKDEYMDFLSEMNVTNITAV